MANIGSMAYQLVLNPAGFTKGLETAQKSLTTFASAIPKSLERQTKAVSGLLTKPIEAFLSPLKNVLTSIPLIGTAFAALPITGAGFVSYLKEGMSHVAELAKLSDRTGIATERLGGYLLACGGDTDVLAKGMFRLNEHLGDVLAGSESTARQINRLGLDALALAQGGADQAMLKIADRIKSLPTPAERAHVAFQLFGKSAESLLPLLLKGADGIEAATRKAQAMGLSFSRIDAQKVIMANKALGQIDLALKGLQTQLAIQLAPWIEAIADAFNEWLDGVDIADMVADGLEWIVEVIGQVVDAIGEAIDFIKGFGNAMGDAVDVAKGFVSAFAIGDIVGIPKISADQFAGPAMEGAEAIEAAAGDAKNAWENPWSVSNFSKFFTELKAKADKNATDMVNAMKGTGEGLGVSQWAHDMYDAFARGAELVKEFESPMAKFNNTVDEMNELLAAGAINEKTFALGIQRAADELEKSTKMADLKGPGSIQAGSKESLEAIHKFERADSQSSPQERLAKLQEQAIKQRERQVKLAEEMAESLKQLSTSDF